eukprot:sb/3466370/
MYLFVQFQEEISLQDLFYLYQLSDMLLYSPLLKHVTHTIAVQETTERAIVIAAHNTQTIRSNTFLDLHEDVVVSLLSRYDLVVESESEVLAAAVRWSRHNRHNTTVFRAVRFYLIKSGDLRKWSADKRLWNALIPLTQVPLFLDQRQRESLRCLYVIGGKDQDMVEVYNLRKGVWGKGKSLPEPRHSATAITLNSSIVVMGGIIDNETTSSVVMFRTDWNSWIPLPSMNTPRSGAGAAVLQGRVFVCGGRNKETALSSCEIFDPQTHSWSYIKVPYPKERSLIQKKGLLSKRKVPHPKERSLIQNKGLLSKRKVPYPKQRSPYPKERSLIQAKAHISKGKVL